MNGYNRHHRNRGISLIEALIAIAVLAVGLLAIAKFQGGLTAGSGLTKTRACAVQLAEDKLEELRNLIIKDQYDNIATANTGPIDCGNANVNLAWTVTDQTNPVRKNIQVAATWTDAKEGNQTLTVTGDIAWDDPKLSSNLTTGEVPGGGFVEPPTGGARLGDENDDTYTPGDVPGTPNTTLDGTEDGTSTYYNTDKGQLELIDTETGTVKLVLTGGDEFSTVEGKVFIRTGNDADATAIEPVFSAASSVAYCSKTTPADYYVTATDGDIYVYFYYKCYFGPGWYGNIGLMVEDGANDDVCLGDPSYANDGLSTSRHPRLENNRMYRGYEQQFAPDGITPLTDADGDLIYTSTGIDAGASYTGHHFLLTNFTGNPTDANCQTELNAFAQPNDFTGDVAGNDSEGNPGLFFCLSASCPDVLPVDLGPAILATPRTISGSLNLLSGLTQDDLINTSVVVSEGGTCTWDWATSLDYTCTVGDLGNGWTGTVALASDHKWTPMYYSFDALMTNSSGHDFDIFAGLTISGTVSNPDTNESAAATLTLDGMTCATLSIAKRGSATYSCNATLTAGSWSGSMTLEVKLGTRALVTTTCPLGPYTGDATANFSIVTNNGAVTCP